MTGNLRADRRRIGTLAAVVLAMGVSGPGCASKQRRVDRAAPAVSDSSSRDRVAVAPTRSSPSTEVSASADEVAVGGDVEAVAYQEAAVIAASEVRFETTVDGATPPAEADGDRRSSDHFVALAVARHPKLRAARERVAAASYRIAQAGALPDPTFANTFWPLQQQAIQTAAGRVGNQMSLSQSVPWPEKLRAKEQVASREVQMARAEVDRVEQEIIEAVRLAYYELWFASRALDVIEETEELLGDLRRVAQARYRSGGSQQDVLRAELESDRLADQRVAVRRQQQVAQADLATLVQQPVTLTPQAEIDLPLGDVPARLDELIALAEQCNPELRGLAGEIRRDRANQRLACAQQYPDVQLGVNWGLVSDDQNVLSAVADGHDNLSFTVGTTLPIWRDKINAGVREAAHRTAGTTQRLQAERDQLQGTLRRLLAQADALDQQRRIYRERIIPRTEDTLQVSVADYRGQRTDFFALLETYRELLMFEIQVARMEASLAGVLAQIERAVGCPVL